MKIMKMWIAFGALFLLLAVPAFADVSEEVVVGLESDSLKEAKDNGADITGQLDETNSLFVVQYTHFFAPLADDGKPIELRRFYQHPSTLSAGLAFYGSTEKDKRVPSDSKTNASLLLLGGEYFFPTNTGLFLDIGLGSGTVKETSGGIAKPDADIQVSQSDLGVRQYVSDNVALELRFHGESTEFKPSGSPERSVNKNITYLGIQGVIRDTVGLKFELGGGEMEQKQVVTTNYDVGAVNLEGAVYVNQELSFRLSIEAEVAKMTGLPSGFGQTISTGSSTLAVRYWFSERFGLEVPLYSETTEVKNETFGIETKDTQTNSGIGIYAAFRF